MRVIEVPELHRLVDGCQRNLLGRTRFQVDFARARRNAQGIPRLRFLDPVLKANLRRVLRRRCAPRHESLKEYAPRQDQEQRQSRGAQYSSWEKPANSRGE